MYVNFFLLALIAAKLI